jgi:hypothetical protein
LPKLFHRRTDFCTTSTTGTLPANLGIINRRNTTIYYSGPFTTNITRICLSCCVTVQWKICHIINKIYIIKSSKLNERFCKCRQNITGHVPAIIVILFSVPPVDVDRTFSTHKQMKYLRGFKDIKFDYLRIMCVHSFLIRIRKDLVLVLSKLSISDEDVSTIATHRPTKPSYKKENKVSKK